MKRIKIYAIAIITIFLMLLCSCNKKEKTNNNNYYLEFKTASIELLTYEVIELPINTNANLDDISFKFSTDGICTIIDNHLVGLKEGQVSLEATINNEKANLNIEVKDDNEVPFLEIDENNINLFVDSYFIVNPKVYLRSELLNANIKYQIEDESVINAENNRIIAKKEGNTTLNIIASYYGFDGDNNLTLSRTINVNVIPSVIVSIDANELVINNREDVINGVEYKNKTKLSGSVYLNNSYQDIFSQNVTFKSSNEDVATIDNGYVIGKSVGTTSIYASIDIDGVSYESNRLNIKVTKPIIKIDMEALDIDLSSSEFDIPLSFMIDGDNKIINIYDQDNDELSIYTNNSLSYDELGPQKWIVESNKNNYLIDVICCSKIITTKEELASIHTYGKNIIKESAGIVSYEGYYILANDIDMRNTRFKTYCGITTGATSVIYNGFIGTFDGRGHTIYNAEVSASKGGLFGTLNKASVVKNVAFINAISSGESGLITSNCGGTIENVYVEGKLTCTHATKDSPSSLLASRIFDGAKITNCVIKITNPKVNNNYSSAIGMFISAKEDALHNVYVLGTNYKVISTTAADKYNILINQDNGQFENYSDLLLQDLSSFNECWEFNEDSIIFKPINKD